MFLLFVCVCWVRGGGGVIQMGVSVVMQPAILNMEPDCGM